MSEKIIVKDLQKLDPGSELVQLYELEFVKDNFGPEALVEEIEDELLLKPLKLRGFARSDEYGLSFFARSCEPANELNVPNVARQFLASLEG